ncbi:MAG: TetR/AcrR family transcriptional regulator [Clostridia bacterium]|nr:TetR/AcrR family transcriptional regulator [Clostridia bacterium]
MKNNNSKYYFTAQLMNQALISLLEKKDIEFITVTEITKKAGVNRSTFYLHYENIYDLLEETIQNLNERFINSFNIKVPLKITSPKDAYLITNDFLIPYLNFCKENKRVLKLVNKKPESFRNKDTYQKMYNTIFYPAITQFVKKEDERIYFLEFFTQGVASIVHKWLELDCSTKIEELIEIIKKCINYNI